MSSNYSVDNPTIDISLEGYNNLVKNSMANTNAYKNADAATQAEMMNTSSKYWTTDPTTGVLHYNVKGNGEFDTTKWDTTLNLGSGDTNYNIVSEKQNTISSAPNYYDYSFYDTGVNKQAEIASNVEKVNSYIDTYLPSVINTGVEQANQSYNSNVNAARNTWLQAINDASIEYGNNATSKQNELQTARQSYNNTMNQVSSDYFNSLQQGRENAAARGLTNSGLMQALEQQIVNNYNNQRQYATMEYNNQVAQLNNEISQLVQNYGLSKSEADAIYNNTYETLTNNYNSQLEEVKNNAWQTVLDYQKEIDIYNAEAYNEMQRTWLDDYTSLWNTESSNRADYAIAQLQSWTDLSIAQLESDTDKWIAQLSSDDKKWAAQFDRTTQLELAQFDKETQLQLAEISGKYGVSAAATAANADSAAQKYGYTANLVNEFANGLMDKGYSATEAYNAAAKNFGFSLK